MGRTHAIEDKSSSLDIYSDLYSCRRIGANVIDSLIRFYSVVPCSKLARNYSATISAYLKVAYAN